MTQPPSQPSPPQPHPHKPAAGTLRDWQGRGGLLGAVASVGLLLVKVGPLLVGLFTKGNLLLTLGSMFLYIWALASSSGWVFGVGAVLLILVHELGHVWAACRLRLKVHALVFVPLMGAFVSSDRAPTVAGGAFVSLMGPVFGGAAGLACLLLYAGVREQVFLLLAFLSFLINLFNLAPMSPLDGSRILPVLRESPLNAARAAQDPYYRATGEERSALRRAYWGVVLGLVLLTAASFALLVLRKAATAAALPG
ncbi:MAG TPA: site-2 protease family protein [Armatimonadaceae bacterium]|nr:site-2 protease family protein [Armatimonadaceae bacterium]